MPIIYKITNMKNNKSYIGQTKNSLKERWYNHQYDAKYSNKRFYFLKAIRKYDPSVWITEIIEEVNNVDLLNEREIYWINFYETFAPKGYNSTNGGSQYNVYSDEAKQKMRNAWTPDRREKAKLMMKERAKNHPKMIERYEDMKINNPMHNNETRKKVSNTNKGRKKGPHSFETKMLMSLTKLGNNNPMFGNTQASAHLNKTKHKCDYCDVITTKGNLVRWHNEKCKNVSQETECDTKPSNP